MRNGSWISIGAGLAVLTAAQYLMLRKVEPFYSWFYSFAWWSYIWIADTVVHRLRGRSLIRSRTREFLYLLPMSVTCWLIFEMFNLALKNWSYVNLPPDIRLRWPGYALAYATVLPGIFETAELLEAAGLFRNIRSPRPPATLRWTLPCFVLGAAATLAAIVWPRYCFPLVWVGPTCLLEPLLFRAGEDSLVRLWREKGIRPLLNLFCAGAACGFLWEFWNFWAGAKWVYTIPFVSFLKIFEMPLLGFLGFPVFALECYVMTAAMKWTGNRFPGSSSGWKGWVSRLLAVGGTLAFWAFAFHQIDRHSVISFAP